MTAEIRVALSKVNAKPPLRALADVTIKCDVGDVTIRRCAVFEKYGQPPWAILPRLPIEKDGKTRYVPLIELPGSLNQRILDALLEEYRRVADGRD